MVQSWGEEGVTEPLAEAGIAPATDNSRQQEEQATKEAEKTKEPIFDRSRVPAFCRARTPANYRAPERVSGPVCGVRPDLITATAPAETSRQLRCQLCSPQKSPRQASLSGTHTPPCHTASLHTDPEHRQSTPTAPGRTLPAPPPRLPSGHGVARRCSRPARLCGASGSPVARAGVRRCRGRSVAI